MKRARGDQVPRNEFLYKTVVWVGIAGFGTIATAIFDLVPLSDWSMTPKIGAESEIAAAKKVGRKIFNVYVKMWVIIPV